MTYKYPLLEHCASNMSVGIASRSHDLASTTQNPRSLAVIPAFTPVNIDPTDTRQLTCITRVENPRLDMFTMFLERTCFEQLQYLYDRVRTVEFPTPPSVACIAGILERLNHWDPQDDGQGQSDLATNWVSWLDRVSSLHSSVCMNP
jgi:hypothetical protein